MLVSLLYCQTPFCVKGGHWMEPAVQRMKVFISYSHKDQWYWEEFQRHLQFLENQGQIEPWHDKKIEDDAQWRTAIEKTVHDAKVVILLISGDFLGSRFFANNEFLLLRSSLTMSFCFF